jgi:hypothetical protein
VRVLDYSDGFPGAKAIKAAGFGGAVRYIGFPDRRKCTTAVELDDFTAHELGMALVYEDHADDWRSGYSAGAAAARRARTHANAIGFPQNRPIYFAVDRDVVTEDEFRAAMAYLRGAASVLGAEWVGVYGEHDVCARAAAEGAARWFWQCRAWSGTPVRMFAGRHLYQYYGDGDGGPAPFVGGVQSDINEVAQDDWGQHIGGNMVSWSDTARTIGEGDSKRDVSYEEMFRSMDDNTGLTRDNTKALLEQIAAQGALLAELAKKVDGIQTGTGYTLDQIADAVLDRQAQRLQD